MALIKGIQCDICGCRKMLGEWEDSKELIISLAKIYGWKLNNIYRCPDCVKQGRVSVEEYE